MNPQELKPFLEQMLAMRMYSVSSDEEETPKPMMDSRELKSFIGRMLTDPEGSEANTDLCEVSKVSIDMCEAAQSCETLPEASMCEASEANTDLYEAPETPEPSVETRFFTEIVPEIVTKIVCESDNTTELELESVEIDDYVKTIVSKVVTELMNRIIDEGWSKTFLKDSKQINAAVSETVTKIALEALTKIFTKVIHKTVGVSINKAVKETIIDVEKEDEDDDITKSRFCTIL